MTFQSMKGGSVTALIYIATNQRAGRPRPGYLESIVAAATHDGLPQEHVNFLRTWGQI